MPTTVKFDLSYIEVRLGRFDNLVPIFVCEIDLRNLPEKWSDNEKYFALHLVSECLSEWRMVQAKKSYNINNFSKCIA